MSEDYIETTSLTHFALSVPQVCKQILEYLDDKSLMSFRILSHFWKNFVDKQRFTWIRIIKEIRDFYGDIKNDCDNEVYAWKTILEKGSLNIVKELGIAIRRLYVLHDDILRSDGTHEKYEDSVFNGIKRYGNKDYHLLIIAAYHGNFEVFKAFLSLSRIKIQSTMIAPGQLPFTLLQHLDILKCVN